MTLNGEQYIGKSRSSGSDRTFLAFNPKTGGPLPVTFREATMEEVDAAVKLAESAFQVYVDKSRADRAAFLESIAEALMDMGDLLIERCMLETALPAARLQGERARTVSQLRLFAEVVREGSWVDARIDTSIPDRRPAPRPDIRHMLIPLGPVAVFGASNFPLAFSVAGGDTASALAAGCPVIVKGHPAHPGTSELVAGAIIRAAGATGMPDGVCSLLQGASNEVGGQLVRHPLIQAVGFTGSFRGGKALFDMETRRPRPIPVFAGMGSSNPVFFLPGALAHRGRIAEGLAASVTLGVGQFCTNPGLVFVAKGENSDDFRLQLAANIQDTVAGTMLTGAIKAAYEDSTAQLGDLLSVHAIAAGREEETPYAVKAKIFHTSFETFRQRPELSEEIFGPSSILVSTPNKPAVLEAAAMLEGHLTATIHGTEQDFLDYRPLFSILRRKVGRLIINGYPTGVEVCHSMVHGGPFPATTAAQTTSVGTNAIRRFARPVCFQDFPSKLLPEALQDDNPANIWRLVNGRFTKSGFEYPR